MSQGPSKEEYGRAVQALHEWLPPRSHPSIAKQLSAANLACSPANLYACIMSSCTVPITSSQVERLRDAVFIPMAKYSTDPVLMSAFFTAMSVIMQDFARDSVRFNSVFATPEIVAVILDLGARAALWQEKKVDLLSMFAVLMQISLSVQSSVLITPAVRDTLFVACAKHATTIEGRQLLLSATSSLLRVREGRELFATPAVRDKVIIPSGRIAATPGCVETVVKALASLAWTRSTLYHTVAIRDQVFLPLAKYATDYYTAKMLLCAVVGIAQTKPGSALFCTKAVRDRLFVAAARHATTADDATHCLEALSTVIQPPCREPLILDNQGIERRELFAVKSVRDFVILPLARLRPGVLYLAEALLFLASSPSGPAVFGTPTVRDEIILPMVPAALDDSNYATACLIQCVWMLCVKGDGSGLFGTEAGRDQLFIPLANSGVADACIIHALGGLLWGTHASDSVRVFAVPSVRDVLVRLARSVSPSESPTFFMALTLLVLMKPSCFATCAVRDGIFVRLFEIVATSRRGHVEFVAALLAFRDTPLVIDAEALSGQGPLLAAKDEAPLTFRQQVLVLLAEKATTVHTAALLAQVAM